MEVTIIMAMITVMVMGFLVISVGPGGPDVNQLSQVMKVLAYLGGGGIIIKIMFKIGLVKYLYNNAYHILFKEKSAKLDLEIELCEKEETALESLRLLIATCGKYKRIKLKNLAQDIVRDFLVLKINNNYRILVLDSISSINIILDSSKADLNSLMQEKYFCDELEINLNSINNVIKVLQREIKDNDDKLKDEMKEFVLEKMKNISIKLDKGTIHNDVIVKDFDEIHNITSIQK